MSIPRPNPGGTTVFPPQSAASGSSAQQPLGPGSSSRYGNAIRVNTGFKIGPAAADNTIVQCPAYRVPVGAKFTLLAPNGNVGLAQASETREDLIAGVGDILPNITPVDYPVDNTARVWVLLAKAGDYVNGRVTNEG